MLQAAGRLALERSGARVIGVTGATGKTTTKDILVAMLRAAGAAGRGHARATATPRSACRCRCIGLAEGCEVAVVEMGMRGTGQIAELAALAPPDVACVTSIGPVHLELLGTVEAVAAGEGRDAPGAAPRRHRGGARGRAPARALRRRPRPRGEGGPLRRRARPGPRPEPEQGLGAAQRRGRAACCRALGARARRRARAIEVDALGDARPGAPAGRWRHR